MYVFRDMSEKPKIVSLQIVESIGKINIEESHQMCPTCLAVKKGFASQPYLCPLSMVRKRRQRNGEPSHRCARLTPTLAGDSGLGPCLGTCDHFYLVVSAPSCPAG